MEEKTKQTQNQKIILKIWFRKEQCIYWSGTLKDLVRKRCFETHTCTPQFIQWDNKFMLAEPSTKQQSLRKTVMSLTLL